jgi:hypothetical protein
MWILKNSKDLLEYIQSKPLSSYKSITIVDLSTLYTTIPHLKLKDIKRISPTLFLKIIIANVDTNLILLKKNHWFYQKSSLKLILSKCWSFFYLHYVCCLVDVFFDKLLTYIPIGTNCSSSRRLVPLFARGRLYTWGSQEKRKETNPILSFHVPLYRWCPFTK